MNVDLLGFLKTQGSLDWYKFVVYGGLLAAVVYAGLAVSGYV